MPSFLPSFTLPYGSREFPYGMPTTMMVDLQTSASTYADNPMTITSPFNSHLALGSTISNPSQMAQQQGGLRNIP